jgi:methyl-accepting chemotaxis protein
MAATLSDQEIEQAFYDINRVSNRIIAVAICLCFAFGLFLTFFYDTMLIALVVGGSCMVAYFAVRALLPDFSVHQYVASAVFGIFSAQFIYQMHGLFEMHFFFFVGSALLITFRNWRLIIPLLLITVIHHATFAWLQYNGMKEIYFTQLEYMDLQAFLFHAFLAAVIMGICGYWAFDLERNTLRDAMKNKVLAQQLANVKTNIAFAEQMSKGNLNADYQVTDDTDELGKSLLVMQENLRSGNERETEEKFITTGINAISEIIRQNSTDTQRLYDELIKGLVKYGRFNQGALFLYEEAEETPYLNMVSCYAYQRKKHLKMQVSPGDGLVGQCFLERAPVYITTVPSGYVRITSGLGEATPSCIFLVPVKTNEEVVGVIELASFSKLKDHEKEFVQKAAENIASAIISSRTTLRIQKLLVESQQRMEELRSQEEEMRQNMEELTATQEEMRRKTVEAENHFNAIEESGIASIEFDLDGIIVTANRHFTQLMGYTLDEIKGEHHRIFVDKTLATSQEYANFWSNLRQGIARPGEYKRITKTGAAVFIKGSYSIIRDMNGKPLRILKLASDITALKKKEQELEVARTLLEKARQSHAVLDGAAVQ